jgi:hypothetical protein
VTDPPMRELVINLKTAKTLGLDLPLHLQQRADEMIEQLLHVAYWPKADIPVSPFNVRYWE